MALSTMRISIVSLFLAIVLLAAVQGDSPLPEAGVVTLWANDEPRSAFSFDDGSYALDIADGQAVLDRAQIVFHRIEAQKISIGFSLAQATRIVDLGDLQVDGFARVSDLAPHPPISIFHTLFLQGRSLWYRGPIARSYSLKAADPVFFTLQTSGPHHFVPELGHVYVMRYAPKRESGVEEKLVKFRVVDYEPGRQVTIRWARMK